LRLVDTPFKLASTWAANPLVFSRPPDQRQVDTKGNIGGCRQPRVFLPRSMGIARLVVLRERTLGSFIHSRPGRAETHAKRHLRGSTL